ncbi:MAG: FecR family protein [Nitrospira sp.]|nr:FecR family protein [Nitrospira sp.]
MAWFARLRSERCSPDEQQAFESWRNQTPSHARAYEEVLALWDDPDLREAANEAALALPRSEPGAAVRFRPQIQVRQFMIAAMIAGLVVLTGLQLDLPVRLLSDHSTSTGEQRVVTLSDHSTVTLNAQSAIDEAFDDSTRRVRLLKGEAFFQVAHNELKPFVVDSGAITARAVGTAFVVRQESNGIRVTVTEGVVELAPLQPAWPSLRLTVGQQVSVTTERVSPVQGVDPSQATAWLRGRLVVDNVRFGDVIDELRRYYPGTILIWNSAMNEIRVSGNYNIADPAAMLIALNETLPVNMAKMSDRIVIFF